jgi:Flp pilus assembly protein TadD
MLAGCSGKPEPVTGRLAILPFENLTGNPSFDWVATAAPAIVVGELTAVDKILPARVQTVSDAYLARATRLVHGYFTQRGPALHFEIEIEDAARHKMVKAAAADGSVMSAMDAVAKDLAPGARAFPTSKPEAVEAWGRGEYERAVQLDSDFGPAWLARVEQLAAEGQTSTAEEAAGIALARPALRSDVDRARIELVLATLRKDEDARTKALKTLAHLVTADSDLTEALAQIELNARNFSAAAEQYKSILKTDPSNAAAMNSLGYTEAYLGDLDAARKAFEDYERQPGQKPNALDSLGEAYFINGRFPEAEKYFLQAHESNPALLNGGDLLKAAYAHWLGGDPKGADQIMQRYLGVRSNLHDPLLVWREATWLFATGRREQAISKLESAPAKENQLIEKQMAVWRGAVAPPSDLTALKEMYERSSPAADGEVRTFYAAALLAAGRKDEAQKLLARWPLPEAGGDPLFQSLMYPKFIELRKQAGGPTR